MIHGYFEFKPVLTPPCLNLGLPFVPSSDELTNDVTTVSHSVETLKILDKSVFKESS